VVSFAVPKYRPLDPNVCAYLVAGARWQSRLYVNEFGCESIRYSCASTGYPVVRCGLVYTCSRVALVASLGHDLGPGMQVGHTCHDEAFAAGLCVDRGAECPHRRCVDVRHLVEQSQQTNILAGGSRQAANARKLFCLRGHPLTGSDARLVPSSMARGEKMCLTCMEERAALVRDAHRGLGITRSVYVGAFGQSRAAAERVLADLAAGRDPYQ
jgi:hypothetical protein